jgi:uncharacterized cupin superfamily protein
VRKVNLRDLEDFSWASPKGKYAGSGKEVSEALGRHPDSTDLEKRHPFDVEVARIPPGKTNYPYHVHSAQWEFYQVIAGTGSVRHKDGDTRIEPGEAFLFKPGEPHNILNDGAEDLVLFVVADNPIGESCHYPDSGKWAVQSPEKRVMRSEGIPYYDGEE